MNTLLQLILFSLLGQTLSFTQQHQQSLWGSQKRVAGQGSRCNRLVIVSATNDQDDVESINKNNDDELNSSAGLNRREALLASTSSLLAGGLFLSTMNPAPAFAADAAASIGSSADKPIVVLGAGGKVGKLCTQILADKGLYVKATTRSGRQILDSESPYVAYGPCDVTSSESLSAALAGASGVIFAASASGKKKGGEPIDVDYIGTYKTAKACLEAGVSKLVLVSAGTVTRPDSVGFKATNFFVKYVYGEKVMDSKIAGEAAMRDLYAASGKPGLAYSVVRPGGLNDKASVGSKNVHISQGDVYSSEISREDVALVTVEALLKGAATDFTTFELNQVEGLGKAMGSLPDLPAELVHTGEPTFSKLLDGLYTDEAMAKKYPDLINDFRGDGLKPIDQLV